MFSLVFHIRHYFRVMLFILKNEEYETRNFNFMNFMKKYYRIRTQNFASSRIRTHIRCVPDVREGERLVVKDFGLK